LIEQYKGTLAELFDLALLAEVIAVEVKGIGQFEQRYGTVNREFLLAGEWVMVVESVILNGWPRVT
jgi:hypothetical protein